MSLFNSSCADNSDQSAFLKRPPELPWMKWTVGTRVVVRYREEDGIHDALGTLLEVAPDHVVIQARRGPITVHAETMITGKQVPPARW